MKTPVLLLVVTITVAIAGFPAAAVKSPASNKQHATATPLYADVVSRFKQAHLRVTEVQKRCTVFFEGEWTNENIYNYAVIMVENSDEDVQVTFYLTDAHEMNWITEFLDAPFFEKSETEKLFGLVNSARDVRNQKIGRFRVDFHRWQPKHADILVFSFTPVK